MYKIKLILLLMLSMSAHAGNWNFQGMNGAIQNLLPIKNSNLEIVAEFIGCVDRYFPQERSCSVKKTLTSRIDSYGNYHLPSKKLKFSRRTIEYKFYLTIRSRNDEGAEFSHYIDNSSYNYRQVSNDFTLFKLEPHNVEVSTLDGLTFDQWRESGSGVRSLKVTRNFYDKTGELVYKLEQNNLDIMNNSIIEFQDKVVSIGKYIRQEDRVTIEYIAEDHDKKSEGYVLGTTKIELRASDLSKSELIQSIILDPSKMDYNIEGKYRVVARNLGSGWVKTPGATFKCENNTLTGEIYFQDEISTKVKGTCSKGKAEFYAEAKVGYKNFKGNVVFDNIYNNSVCATMTDILGNYFDTICLVK